MNFSDIATIFAIVLPVVWKLVDFVKYARAQDWNAVTTQAMVWGGGVGLLFLLSRTDFAPTISLGNLAFNLVSGPTIIFIGLSGGSAASIGYDLKKARDNNDTAATPALIPSQVVNVDRLGNETKASG